VFTLLLVGLVPPYPVELKAEYSEADDAERRKLLRNYLVGRYRSQLILSGVAVAMLVKWMWECGLLVYLGATAGFAHAQELDDFKRENTQSNTQLAKRLDRYEAAQLEERISRLDQEAFQLDTAISAAHRARRDPDMIHVNRRRAVTYERSRVIEQLRVISPEAAAALTLQQR
jgi:hypothetical protein